jgi:hypothetical protein
MFLGADILRALLSHTHGNVGATHFAVLCAAAYVFLLRVLSGALPIQWHGACPVPDHDGQASLTLENDVLVLRLRRRKNKQVVVPRRARATPRAHQAWR